MSNIIRSSENRGNWRLPEGVFSTSLFLLVSYQLLPIYNNFREFRSFGRVELVSSVLFSLLGYFAIRSFKSHPK